MLTLNFGISRKQFLILTHMMENQMANINDLVEAVAQQTTTINSMKTFVAGLEAQVREALAQGSLTTEQQNGIDSVFNRIKSNTVAVADAIDNDPTTGGPDVEQAAPGANTGLVSGNPDTDFTDLLVEPGSEPVVEPSPGAPADPASGPVESGRSVQSDPAPNYQRPTY